MTKSSANLKSIKLKIINILGWTLSASLILLALITYIDNEAPKPMVAITALVIAAIITAPYFKKYLKLSFKKKIIIIPIIILVGFGIDGAISVSKNKELKQANDAQQVQARLKEFSSNKDSILEELKSLEDQEKYSQALAEIGKYFDVNDDGLMKIRTRILKLEDKQKQAIERKWFLTKYENEKSFLIPKMKDFFGKKSHELETVMREAEVFLPIGDKNFDKLYQNLEKEYQERKSDERKRQNQDIQEQERINTLKKINVSSAKSSAHVYCEALVKKSLKSPKSADFPWYNEKQVTVSSNNEIFTVRSYIDAQNSFGATLRNNYTCKLQYNGKEWNDWILIDFYMK